MKTKTKKNNFMEPLEILISTGKLKSLLPIIAALHRFLYGGKVYNITMLPIYIIKREEVWNFAKQLVDEYFKPEKNTYTYQKIVEAILFFLTNDGFDIIRYQQNKRFKDSTLNSRLIELANVLLLKPEIEIELAIEYIFALKNIPSDSILRKQIGSITKILHEGELRELSNTAELAIPLKAQLLEYIKSLELPYKNRVSKSMFFIKLLGFVSLEMTEEIFDEYQHRAWQDNTESFSLMFDENHPFLKYDRYFDYVQDRYATINNFLITK